MSESLIADNWSLQNVAELFTNGISSDEVLEILVDKAKDSHTYRSLPHALISLEALFDLITDIVLQDQILVDEKFTNSWARLGTGLDAVAEAGIIRPYGFLALAERFAGPRDEFVERLCLTESIRAAHERNSKQWFATRQTPDRPLSTTLWGGAGMLARAFVYEKGYTPHPLRRRLFQHAGIALPDVDATARLIDLVREKRATLSLSRTGNDTLYALRLSLPPLPVLVVREASNASQLLQIALQMRDKYQELRDWLGEYQQALTKEDFSDLRRFEKTLRSISLYIDSVAGRTDSNAPTFTAGFSALKVTFKGHSLESLRNQFGVRAAVNRLIFAGSGYAELKKLLGFFEHRNTAMAVKVIQHFSRKSSAV